MPNIVAMQQAIIDQELLEMPPEEINEILSTMKNGEAMVFLERLNQVRARAIWENSSSLWRNQYTDRQSDPK